MEEDDAGSRAGLQGPRKEGKVSLSLLPRFKRSENKKDLGSAG